MTSEIICPTCGGERISRVRKTVTRQYNGRAYQVPDLEFEECPDCGERVYDREAMRKIEAYSPAYAHRRPRKSVRRTAAATVHARPVKVSQKSAKGL